MAAIVLKQNFPGFIDRFGVAADFLDKSIDAVMERWNAMPLVNSQFFRTVTPRGGTYQETQFGTVLPLPVVNSDSDRIPFVGPWKGFKKTFTVVEYRSGVRVERRLSEEDLTGKARRLISGLMASGRLLTEYQMADIFNHMISTATAYVGADGVALASASHPFERRTYGTWDNLQDGAAFTSATFSTARTAMRKRTNEFGDPMEITPKIVMIPPDIETAVRTVLASEKVAGGALNDKNVWQNAVEIVVNPYLTSTTSWMLIGDVPKEYCGFLYIPEITPNIAPVTGNDASTDIIWAERLRMIQAVGATIDRNIEYSAGA